MRSLLLFSAIHGEVCSMRQDERPNRRSETVRLCRQFDPVSCGTLLLNYGLKAGIFPRRKTSTNTCILQRDLAQMLLIYRTSPDRFSLSQTTRVACLRIVGSLVQAATTLAAGWYRFRLQGDSHEGSRCHPTIQLLRPGHRALHSPTTCLQREGFL